MRGCSASGLVHRSRNEARRYKRTLEGRFCSASAHCGIPSILCQGVFYESILPCFCLALLLGFLLYLWLFSSLCTSGASALLGGVSMSLALFLVILVFLVMIVVIAQWD